MKFTFHGTVGNILIFPAWLVYIVGEIICGDSYLSLDDFRNKSMRNVRIISIAFWIIIILLALLIWPETLTL